MEGTRVLHEYHNIFISWNTFLSVDIYTCVYFFLLLYQFLIILLCTLCYLK